MIADTAADRPDVAATFGATMLVHGDGVQDNPVRDHNTRRGCRNNNGQMGT
jgi:hypothetical protein